MMEQRARPQVSVVMAVYNGQCYLREAIDSILTQTFIDFEFIIVDDGSTDESAAIVQSINDPRIRLISNPSNVGLAESLNRGISAASGALIARQDSDDLSLPSRLEAQARFLEEHPGVGVVGTSCEWIDSEGKPFKVWPPGSDNPVLQARLLVTCPLVHGSVMFRRQCIDDVGMYDPAKRTGQDYDLWLRIAEKWDLVNLPQVLFQYRWHDQMVSITRRAEQQNHARIGVERAISRRLAYGKARLRSANGQCPDWVSKSTRRWLADRYVWWSQGARSIDRGVAIKFLAIAAMLDPVAPEMWRYLSGIAARKIRRTSR